MREIDGTGKVLMPGLINTHCHVAMTLQRGYADDIALMKWLHEYIWPFEAQQTPDEIVLGAEMGIVEMLLGGVTTFVDMYWHENRIAGPCGGSASGPCSERATWIRVGRLLPTMWSG